MTTKPLPNLLQEPASRHYANLPIPNGQIQATYIWIDSTDEEKICTKTRTLYKKVSKVSDATEWFSSFFNEDGEAIEGYLKPVAIFPDPFNLGDNKIILCDLYALDEKTNAKIPVVTNKRPICLDASKQSKSADPWFGIEQEYTLLDLDEKPLGWPENGFPKTDLLYYFNSIGTERSVGRQVAEAHYRACLYAGIKIYGFNSEEMLAQWEYQIGTLSGIDVCDQLIASRYLLRRVAEDFGVAISFDPKPVPDWPGSSCHTNFSTKSMREEGGMAEIEKAIEKFRKNHEKHLAVYDTKSGEDNKRRLAVSACAAPTEFVSGIFKTRCSVRIPRLCLDENKGYLEDRRPSSSCNPYSVVNAILRTVILEK